MAHPQPSSLFTRSLITISCHDVKILFFSPSIADHGWCSLPPPLFNLYFDREWYWDQGLLYIWALYTHQYTLIYTININIHINAQQYTLYTSIYNIHINIHMHCQSIRSIRKDDASQWTLFTTVHVYTHSICLSMLSNPQYLAQAWQELVK